MEQPILRILKKTDTDRNRIIIPKKVIEKMGRTFYLEVYEDYIKLVPLGKGE